MLIRFLRYFPIGQKISTNQIVAFLRILALILMFLLMKVIQNYLILNLQLPKILIVLPYLLPILILVFVSKFQFFWNSWLWVTLRSFNGQIWSQNRRRSFLTSNVVIIFYRIQFLVNTPERSDLILKEGHLGSRYWGRVKHCSNLLF